LDLLASVQSTLRRTLVARGVSSSLARLGGQPVHYYALEKRGAGPPIVLIHGLAGSANGFYKLFFGLARRFRRVLAPDLPGHGFSPLPLHGPNSVRAQVDVLVEFLEKVAAEPCVVVGNSLGGAMAMTLAAEQPARVRALVLVSPAGARFTREQLVELERAMDIRTVEEARRFTRRLFHRVPLSMHLFAAELRKMYGIPPVKAAFADAKELGHLSPEVLAKIRTPTLLLWGGSDRLLPEQSVEYFRAHFSAARVEVVPRFGHVPQMERPRELLSRILAFADEVGL
jgi:pimeloyl-ACP methyl ester carboxylesterase